MATEERFWPSRLRWRLRGAMLWPAFALLTLADGLLLHWLPPIRTGIDVVPGILLATFGNLFLVAALAPWLSKRMAARARDEAPLKRELLTDSVGTALLLAGVAAVLASGLATRPLVVSETEATESAAGALHSLVQRSGDQELLRNEETANSVRLSEGYFRICIARDDRRSSACFFADTRKSPTEIRRDPSAESNAELFPNGTGR